MTTSMLELDRTEQVAIGLVATAAVGFGAYGFASGAPSTAAYLFVVATGVAALLLLRADLPRPVTIGLAVLAIAHLAGGLVEVGGDVLYNARLGSPVLQYDHFVHASGVFLGVLVLRAVLVPRDTDVRGSLVMLCLLGGLGLGALNELIEFLTTIAHSGAHVGGYENTGWDLFSNLVGAGVAGIVLHRSTAR